MKTFNTILAFVVFIVSVSLACASDKPIVYNFVAGQKTEIDEEVNTQLSPRFKIIDILASKA